MNKLNKKQRIIVFATISVVLVIIIATAILFATFKNRIKGTWLSERIYNEYTNTYQITILEFADDGQYTKVVTDSKDSIAQFEQGYSWETWPWHFYVYSSELKSGGRHVYNFNPITGSLKCGDVKYVKE